MKAYKAAKTDAVSEREREHLRLVRSLAPQCMVLLENDGVLPLASPGPVALYGAGARRTVKGGTGSGEVNSRDVVNIEQGLKNAGFQVVNGPWLDEYDRIFDEAQKAHFAQMKERIDAGENPIMVYFTTPFREPEGPPIRPEAAAPLALYVISRNSGEGKDRDAAPGDYELSEREKADLKLLSEQYEKLVVLLNVGGVIDTQFFKALPRLGALLLVSQAGAVTGDAVADALLGITPPSGRLSDTWALEYRDYPGSDTFGKNDGDTAHEPYSEGIFVGYRWFDTGKKPVAYPFGYGLGYTTFDMAPCFDEADQYGVSGKVKVTNTGARPGREVIQVYTAAPAGRVRKPSHQLAAFAKTRLLEPGESQVIDISFPLKNMASYSEELAAWVLEPGKYYVQVGRNSRDYELCAAVEVEKLTILEQLRNFKNKTKLSADLGASPAPADAAPEAVPEGLPILKLPCDAVETERHVYTDEDVFDTPAPADFVTMADILSGKHTPEELAAQLTPGELARLCVGEFGDQSMIGSAGQDVPGAAGQTIHGLYESRGVGSLVLADGPAGIRITRHFQTDGEGKLLSSGGFFAAFGGGEEKEELPADAVDYYQFCTAIPIATLIAQSWDVELARSLGRIVGREMLEYGVHSWLAPGMNIHRNPLCGRNFEYFSEDPLLCGMMAAAETLGVQETPGVGTTPKHFACNNQEDNRNYSDSMVSEQALREIYLRGFEICIRSAQPMYIMTSYNFINGIHAAMNRDTLTYALRNEWGFGGLVMTDWGTTGGGNLMEKAGEDSIPACCIAAGNDLLEPGNMNDVQDILDSLAGKTDHPLSIASLRLCASRILRVIAGSSLYEGAKPWTQRFETDWFITTK